MFVFVVVPLQLVPSIHILSSAKLTALLKKCQCQSLRSKASWLHVTGMPLMVGLRMLKDKGHCQCLVTKDGRDHGCAMSWLSHPCAGWSGVHGSAALYQPSGWEAAPMWRMEVCV